MAKGTISKGTISKGTMATEIATTGIMAREATATIQPTVLRRAIKGQQRRDFRMNKTD